MCLAQGPQRSDAGEARTRGPSVSSQTLYHWATALPQKKKKITLTTLGDLPWMLLILLMHVRNCLMGAMPMTALPITDLSKC